MFSLVGTMRPRPASIASPNAADVSMLLLRMPSKTAKGRSMTLPLTYAAKIPCAAQAKLATSLTHLGLGSIVPRAALRFPVNYEFCPAH